jgi:hypothetical protein
LDKTTILNTFSNAFCMKKWMFILLLLPIKFSFAQSLMVGGVVNMPCEYVIEGKGDSSMWTDMEGKFQITNLTKGDYIKFDAAGFYPKWLRVDSSNLNIKLQLTDIADFIYFPGCPTSQVLVSNYQLYQMAAKDSILTLDRFDWDVFLKGIFADYVVMHKANLAEISDREEKYRERFINDSLGITSEYQNCIETQEKSKYECQFYKSYKIDSLKRLLLMNKQKLCTYNNNYNHDGYKHFFSCDNSKFQTSIKYDDLEKIFVPEKLSGFKTSCLSDCCENLIFVKTKDGMIHHLDLKLFKAKVFPIDNIQKALFYINYSRLFLNGYAYAIIPFYRVKYIQTSEYFYIEHVLCMQDKAYYHVLIRISRHGKIEILKKDKNFKFGPCY